MYDTDLFDAAAIARLVEHYKKLLATIVADPDCRLSSLSITGEAEVRQLADAFSDDF
jgi:non-ribosomal peptide synthetase component F